MYTSKIKIHPLAYLLNALDQCCSNGDAYVTVDHLYLACRAAKKNLSYDVFRNDLNSQIRSGILYAEGRRVYHKKIWRYEEGAAKSLSEILLRSSFPEKKLPEVLTAGNITLCDEQRDAVSMAVSNRLSLILGGAGCGKSTLVSAIYNNMEASEKILCAPTGKAARNLTIRTNLPARTVHSALGLTPDDDFLAPVEWEFVELVIVDEASMLSLELLAGILNRANEKCRIVLLGDPNQLQSVGAGNVIPDLLALGVPSIRLEVNHRQSSAATGLLLNVVDFPDLQREAVLYYDDSFILKEMEEEEAINALVAEAVQRYRAGESIQVLAPFNNVVADLNRLIRDQVNPQTKEKKTLSWKQKSFRDGDHVMITKNNRDKHCCNGDVGIIHIHSDDTNHPLYSVELSGGRYPKWDDDSGLQELTLAYALTIHKSQGSEYDTILMPVTMSMQRMLYRNLFYTAISRARNEVIIYGKIQAVDMAMQKTLPPRRSMLAAKAHMRMHDCA